MIPSPACLLVITLLAAPAQYAVIDSTSWARAIIISRWESLLTGGGETQAAGQYYRAIDTAYHGHYRDHHPCAGHHRSLPSNSPGLVAHNTAAWVASNLIIHLTRFRNKTIAIALV